MKKKEIMNIIKARTIRDYMKEKSIDMQTSKEASESLQEIMNNILKDLVNKTINNTKFRNGNRIVAKDIIKAYDEFKNK